MSAKCHVESTENKKTGPMKFVLHLAKLVHSEPFTAVRGLVSVSRIRTLWDPFPWSILRKRVLICLLWSSQACSHMLSHMCRTPCVWGHGGLE